VFVNVKFCEIVCPSTTLPKLKLAGDTLSPACAPVPLSVIVTGEPALFVTVMLPVAFPAAVGANFTANVAVCEAFNVAGVVTPLALNPVPAAVTPVICKDAFPVFVNVTFCDPLLPTATLPKLKLVGLAVKLPAGAAVAVPLSVIVTGDPALFATVILPVKLPVEVGANFTANVAVCDASNVAGVLTPLTLKPVPAAVTAVICSAAPPVFVSVMFCDALLPTATLPKLRLVGVAVKFPVGAAVAVPVNPIVIGEPVASLATRMLPVGFPTAVGANFTLITAFCEGLSVTGAVSPLVLNPLPATLTLDICTATVPELVSVIFCDELLPTATLAKFRLVGFAVNCPCAAVVPVPPNVTLDVGVFGSLLVNVMLPETAPAVVGEKVTVTGTVCPALIVFGVAIPLIPNSVPFNVITEMFRSAVPVFPTFNVAVPLDPTLTVPKSTALVLNEICGADVATVPLRLTTPGVDPESPWIVSVPLTLPAVVPFSQTVKFALCPDPIAIGKLMPEIPNCAFEAVTCWMVTVELPLFVSVRFCVAFCPAVTFPKFTLVGETEKLVVPEVCALDPTSPAQPFERSSGISTLATSTAFCHFPQSRRILSVPRPTVPT
jgi:hypothetical protein